jgi:hypothetical protein
MGKATVASIFKKGKEAIRKLHKKSWALEWSHH